MNTAALIVRALENEGVEYIFGVPGEENLAFLEAIRQSETIQFITTRHEQAAGFMAATVGRLTGTPGVALSTLGPGATNFMTAAAYAQLGGMPAVFITGQKPVRQSKQGRFQIIDTVAMFRPLTKFAHQIISGATAAVSVREAFKQATTERPGAAHLELPEDIASETVAPEYTSVLPAEKIRRPVADAKAIAAGRAMIQNAKRPLIVVGAGSNRKQVSKMLTAFIEQTGIPFIPTQMGKGVVSEQLPTYLGTATLSRGDTVHDALNQADLIINVGHDVIEKPPFIMQQSDTRQVLHLDFSPAVVDAIYFPHLEIVGDIGNALWQLKEVLPASATWGADVFADTRAHTEAHRETIPPAHDVPISPRHVIETLQTTLRESGLVTLDNGMYKLWFSRFFRATRPNSLLLDNALATMGAGLPSALAAKLLRPEETVVAVTGDGGFMMNSQELETAVRLQLHLVIVLLVDREYGMIKWKQAGEQYPSYGLDFTNPDFVRYAESYGAVGYAITSSDDFTEKLRTASSAATGVHMLVTPVDYRDNNEQFHA